MDIRRSLPILLMAACVSPVEEGTSEQSIVGGTQATSAAFPTVAGLQHGNGNWFCTGVLVDKDWVMTAATCFDNTNATQARFDDNDIGSNGGRTIDIAEIHKHPNFNINSTTWSHDIAMLKLAQSVTDRTPAMVRRAGMTVGAAVTQVGFGANNNNGNGGGVLRSLATSSIDCAGAQDAGITNANLMCFNAGDGTASCYGDGGAPAFAGGAVAGVASGNTTGSCTSGLDVYTAIAAELAFIDTFLPAAPQPPPEDPPADPPADPQDPNGPDRGDDENPADGSTHKPVARGCNAGGGTGWLVVLGIAIAIGRRRTRH